MTCLMRKKELVETLYEEAFTTGMISEQTFTELSIPIDKNSSGVVVDRDIGIPQENRQRAKTLTSEKQINERKLSVFTVKMNEYKKLEAQYNADDKHYKDNALAKTKILKLYNEFQNRNIDSSIEATSTITRFGTYLEICDTLTYYAFVTFMPYLKVASLVSFVQG